MRVKYTLELAQNDARMVESPASASSKVAQAAQA